MKKLVILSGLAGSGKSAALNAFEDLGYYAIDNLPIKLFDQFFNLIKHSTHEFEKVALVMDLRDSHFLERYPRVCKRVLSEVDGSEIVFLDAKDEVLLKRYSETRRKHPLSQDNVLEGIQKERSLLKELKKLATVNIDTSSMHIHELKRKIFDDFKLEEKKHLQVRILSFGFKHGLPPNADLVLDVRYLNNPHFVPDLKPLNGKNKEVAEFLQKDPRTEVTIDKLLDLLKFVIPEYEKEGKAYLTVAIGCTGGQHRSVYLAERLYSLLKNDSNFSPSTVIEHQNL